MTWGGWLVMLLSVGSVSLLFVWCIWRVLSDPCETGKLHGFDTHTPDEKENS
ncbi:MAG: hypothetical protein Fur0032_21390 [Terrimicrobiaceae bacterium]